MHSHLNDASTSRPSPSFYAPPPMHTSPMPSMPHPVAYAMHEPQTHPEWSYRRMPMPFGPAAVDGPSRMPFVMPTAYHTHVQPHPTSSHSHSHSHSHSYLPHASYAPSRRNVAVVQESSDSNSSSNDADITAHEARVFYSHPHSHPNAHPHPHQHQHALIRPRYVNPSMACQSQSMSAGYGESIHHAKRGLEPTPLPSFLAQPQPSSAMNMNNVAPVHHMGVPMSMDMDMGMNMGMPMMNMMPISGMDAKRRKVSSASEYSSASEREMAVSGRQMYYSDGYASSSALPAARSMGNANGQVNVCMVPSSSTIPSSNANASWGWSRMPAHQPSLGMPPYGSVAGSFAEHGYSTLSAAVIHEPYPRRPKVEINLVALRKFLEDLETEPSLCRPDVVPMDPEQLSESCTQAQLAVEFGLIRNEDAIHQFRFRDFKRNILERASADQLQLFADNAQHSVVTQRLPHRMSRRSFAFRLLMAAFHIALKTGNVPNFWRLIPEKLIFSALPGCAEDYLPEVALLAHRAAVEALGKDSSLAERIDWAQKRHRSTMPPREQPATPDAHNGPSSSHRRSPTNSPTSIATSIGASQSEES